MSATNTNTSQGSSGYDIAGNVTNDGRNAYLYDIEGRLCAVQSGGNGGAATGYLYNAGGQRVAKGALSSFACPSSAASFSAVQSQYLLGQSGEQVTELDGSGNWVHTNVWAGGRLIATYEGSDLYYAMTDWLGTKRAELGASSLCTATYASLPFGNDQTQISGSCPDATEHHFTTKEHDSESGNDYFLARYYASNLGRFLTPDWSAKTDPVPYAKTDNPQSLNLYAYVLNNPLRSFDADGHEAGNPGSLGINREFECMDPENDGCNGYENERSKLQKNTQISTMANFMKQVKHGLGNLLRGHLWNYTPHGSGSFVRMYPPDFYSANAEIGPLAQSVSYVPSTNNLYYGFGIGTGSGISLTAGWATNPNGYVSGSSGSICFFAYVGGCGGVSTTGDYAGQIGIGFGEWGTSGGYGIDLVS